MEKGEIIKVSDDLGKVGNATIVSIEGNEITVDTNGKRGIVAPPVSGDIYIFFEDPIERDKKRSKSG